VIATGAKILGSFKVGENSRIGAGAVVLKEVPPNSTVVGVPGRVVRMDGKKLDDEDFLNHNLPDPLDPVLSNIKSSLEKINQRLDSLEKSEP
jgi:serine O-acetyltransferase